MANITGDLQIQSIISTIHKRCVAEKNDNKLTIPLNRVQERVAFYTGISKNYIVDLSGRLQTDNSEHSLTFHRRTLIMKGLLQFYDKMKLPTINEVYDLLLKQTVLLPLPHFMKEMADLGYSYRKTRKGYLLMEDPVLTFERFHYLKKIMKFRGNTDIKIHYMDERLINKGCAFPKPTNNLNDKMILESLLYCYVVSHNEMVEGMFCNYINRDEILNWIRHTVIPKLKPSSVIVITNNFLYKQESKSPPSPYASKETMLKWLRMNNIPCNNHMRKAELYALITKFPSTVESRDLDFLFKVHGHEVLHLPTSMKDLTPTEKAWQDMKLDLQDKDTQDLYTLKEYVHNYMKTMIPLVHKWSEYEKNVKKMEKSFFDLDKAMENGLDSYNFETDNPLFECQLSVSNNSATVIELE